MAFPASVRLVEVGPRDGLQNEPGTLTTDLKVALIDRLADTGLKSIEAASFVSPKWAPQMADGAEVLAAVRRAPGVRYAALTPNRKGVERAIDAKADEVAVFAAASESFSQKNINCSIAKSLERFESVMAIAKAAGVPVRGYLSCVMGCPYDGRVEPEQVAAVAGDLAGLGCYEISLGDTIGVGTPMATQKMIEAVRRALPDTPLAVHFHDTYGQALANILVALELGIDVIDSSVAGLGGCPYAKGATGNVASEDVLYMLNGLGVKTGVDMAKLVDAAWFISGALGREPASRVARALGRPLDGGAAA